MRALAVSVVLLSLLASAEQPLPVYPGTVQTRIGNDLLISGEYYRLAWFETDDSLQVVGRFFEQQWTEEGYPVTVDGDFRAAGIVSAFYTRQGLVRSVVLRQHDGKTVGFTVLKDLWVREPLARATKLPTLEGALYSQDLVLRDTSGGSQGRSSIFEGSLEKLRVDAAKAFSAAGYALIRDSRVKLEGKPQRVLEFSRGKEQAVVTLAQLQPNLVAVQQTWVGSDRPDAVPNNEAVRAAREERGAR